MDQTARKTVEPAAGASGAGGAAAFLELLKPVTWFPPMWAFGIGVLSGGGPQAGQWLAVVAGVLVAGPLVCGTSQAVNDWFDRNVDAINEPGRPIPSGRVPGRRGLYFALAWTALSLAVATLLGPWGFGAAVLGMVLAWIYSAPPLRLKQNGWWGNSAVALSYEGLPWFTGAAVVLGSAPSTQVVILALLYSIGAHGIMTVNDFKSVEGDRRMGVRSLPVQLGLPRAAVVTCAVMALSQAVAFVLLVIWGYTLHGVILAALLLAQLGPMKKFMMQPRDRAPWFNGTGISLFVLGMLVCALALRSGLPGP